MGVGQLSESDAVDALRLPFYSSSHPTGSHGWRNQFDLGNPDLNLLSSWRSHWPTGLPKTRMVGLGLNAVEMEHNPALDEYVVHDLNSDTTFPFDDASFDAVIITVSMQYLVHPVEVFRQVNRVLRPGGVFLVVYSNRMFSTKAVWIWMACSDQQRARLIATYMEEAGNFTDVEGLYVPPQGGPDGDPIYAVAARKAT